MKYEVVLREFEESDIPAKVRWINDPEVNRYLHYDIPLREDRTREWFRRKKGDAGRLDYVIDVMDNGKPVPAGLVGLLNIDATNRKAEFYITVGEKAYWGVGVASKASVEFIDFCFRTFFLNRLYLFTERGNLPARRLFEKTGFKKEGLLIEDLIHMGRRVDRYVYGLLRKDFYHEER